MQQQLCLSWGLSYLKIGIRLLKGALFEPQALFSQNIPPCFDLRERIVYLKRQADNIFFCKKWNTNKLNTV